MYFLQSRNIFSKWKKRMPKCKAIPLKVIHNVKNVMSEHIQEKVQNHAQNVQQEQVQQKVLQNALIVQQELFLQLVQDVKNALLEVIL